MAHIGQTFTTAALPKHPGKSKAAPAVAPTPAQAPESAFLGAIMAAGLTPPEHIKADGKLHRFSSNGKRGDLSGWYALHLDGVPAGSFGCWRTVPMQTWCSKADNDMTTAEKHAMRQRMQDAKAARDTEKAQDQAAAQADAQTRWDAASPAPASHPYLVAKGVQGHGLRLEGDKLLVPIRDTAGTLHSLQTITQDGDKRFLPYGRKKGCFHTIGKFDPARPIVICEGFATGASIHEATGLCVVVAFDAGSLLPVAQGIRAACPPATKLILAADNDTTTEGNPGLTKATEAARTVAGVLALAVSSTTPGKKVDFNDLHQSEGLEAVARLIESAAPAVAPSQPAEAMFPPLGPSQYDAPPVTTKPATDTPMHPLARIVTLRKRPPAARWTVPGVVELGLVTIAGARGVGKTTSVLPLAMTTAGLHEPDYKLAPKADRWRHVIYITEHLAQVEGIIAGIVDCAGWGITWEAVEERIHVVEAKRLPIDDVTAVAGFYKSFARTVDGVEILPLIVFDTQAACFEMTNENDNSEASKIMAALKQNFHGAPIWIIGHVAKTNIGRSNAAELTARGAGAWEGDSIQNLYLVKEGEEERTERFLLIGKHRAEPKYGDTLAIVTGHQIADGVNEWGEIEKTYLRWTSIQPMDASRKEQREQAQAEEAKARAQEMRQDILDAVDTAWRIRNPLSKTGARDKAAGNTISKQCAIDALINEGWLHEITVPSKERVNSNKKSFLIRLSTEEHEHFSATGLLPEDKQVVPQSWRKTPSPSVPSVPTTDSPESDESIEGEQG